MALTRFSDLTEQEFRRQYTTLLLDPFRQKIQNQYYESIQKEEAKKNINFPPKNNIQTPVPFSDPITGPPIDWYCRFLKIKNQGDLCGSCYAIVTTDTIELTYKIHGQPILPMSYQ